MMLKKLFSSIKFISLALVGISIVLLLNEFNRYTQVYFQQNSMLEEQFSQIKNDELSLNHDILTTSLYMYNNNDKINNDIDVLNSSINKLINNVYLKTNYPKILKDANLYKKSIEKKIENIYRFQTLNSSIKNSTMYLANSLSDLPKISSTLPYDQKNLQSYSIYKQSVLSVISSIFLARNSFDSDFLKSLDLNYFKDKKFKNAKLNRFNQIFSANLNLFVSLFREYKEYLNDITNKNSINIIDKIQNEHLSNVASNLKIIKWVSYLLILFVIATIIAIMFFMYRLKEDNETLENLTKKLYRNGITDKLTGLYNRNKYEADTKKFKDSILLLVNIDRFKYLNDYFGTHTGDKILKKVALSIKDIVKNIDATLYRLGADEYGIFLANEECRSFEQLSKDIIKYFNENELKIDGMHYNISVSIGISNIAPYQENADIALKYIRKSSRKKYMMYSDDLDEKEEIRKNIERTKVLYQAIKDNRIVPYFQPIVKTESKRTVKYEVLSRVIHPDGKVESIYPYLNIAKENKLYSHITQIALKRSFAIFNDNQLEFSINLSMEDISDPSIVNKIYKLLNNENIAKRVTFEMLESEAIKDYKEVKSFIESVKAKGAKIAIDDFGSGYSNFSHILNLNIDYIKIDGSLIKHIDSDTSALKIVKLISKFAKESGMQIIAEFVENESIYNTLKELDIEYLQGYYFSKPLEKI